MKKKNIQHVWSVISEDSVVDSTTNKLSILNTIEEVTINLTEDKVAKEDFKKISKDGKGVVLPLKYNITSLWLNEGMKNEEFPVTLSLVSPDGKSLWKKENQFKFVKDKLRTRTIIRFGALEIGTKSGLYFILLSWKGKDSFQEVVKIPLEFKIIK
jgi:hypothetical protein